MNWYSYQEFPVDTVVSVALFCSLGMLITSDSVPLGTTEDYNEVSERTQIGYLGLGYIGIGNIASISFSFDHRRIVYRELLGRRCSRNDYDD